MSQLKVVKNYINGKWVEAENTGYINVENPSTGEVLAKTPLSNTEETNRAIESAAEAPRPCREPRRSRPVRAANASTRRCHPARA